MSVATTKVPTLLAACVICAAAGGALGVGVMYGYGYRIDIDKEERAAAKDAPAANGAPRAPMGGPGGMMPGAGGPGGQRGPSPKAQLAALVTKLDQLTSKPLAVKLDEAQQKKVREQLAGLADKDDLSDEVAKEKLDALLELLKDQRETLEAAGFRWPGQRGGFGQGGNAANPFKDEKNAEHLKSLMGPKGPKA